MLTSLYNPLPHRIPARHSLQPPYIFQESIPPNFSNKRLLRWHLLRFHLSDSFPTLPNSTDARTDFSQPICVILRCRLTALVLWASHQLAIVSMTSSHRDLFTTDKPNVSRHRRESHHSPRNAQSDLSFIIWKGTFGRERRMVESRNYRASTLFPMGFLNKAYPINQASLFDCDNEPLMGPRGVHW